jgi:hypothetical protein
VLAILKSEITTNECTLDVGFYEALEFSSLFPLLSMIR